MNKINNKRRKSAASKGISSYVYLFLLVIIPLILNWKNISYEFTTSDDVQIIINNYSFLSDFKNVPQAFEKDNFMSRKGEGYYRPVQTVSFMIDTQMNGDRFFVYHLSNLLYHILTVIVLFFLLRKLGVRDDISFFLSLLFSVHPLLTDAIAWIPGRGDILAGLFCSISFLSFIYYYFTKNKWFFFFHSAALLLALFSKEISVFLPVVLIFYYWFVLKNKYKIRALVPFILIWSFSCFVFFFLRYTYLHPKTLLSFNAFISNLQVIPIFLGKLFIPLGLSPLPVYDILFTVIGLIIFMASGIYIMKIKIENKSLVILGLVWFLGFIIPAMFAIFPSVKVHSDYLECRAYLPSIGIIIVLGVLLNEIIKRKGINILVKSFIPVVLILAVLSYNYSNDFADGLAYYSSVIKSNPDNEYAFTARGNVYLSKNNFNLALADFDNSIKINPNYSLPYFNKGDLYNSMNDHINAEKSFSIALNYDTLYPGVNDLHEKVYINLSTEKFNLKKYEESIVILKKAIGLYPDNQSLHNNLGFIYYYTDKFDSAITEYKRAIQLEPNSFLCYNNCGKAEFKANHFIDAINDFNMALKLKTDFSEAYYYRGLVYSKINKPVEAENDLSEARRLGFKEPVNEK